VPNERVDLLRQRDAALRLLHGEPLKMLAHPGVELIGRELGARFSEELSDLDEMRQHGTVPGSQVLLEFVCHYLLLACFRSASKGSPFWASHSLMPRRICSLMLMPSRSAMRRSAASRGGSIFSV